MCMQNSVYTCTCECQTVHGTLMSTDAGTALRQGAQPWLNVQLFAPHAGPSAITPVPHTYNAYQADAKVGVW